MTLQSGLYIYISLSQYYTILDCLQSSISRLSRSSTQVSVATATFLTKRGFRRNAASVQQLQCAGLEVKGSQTPKNDCHGFGSCGVSTCRSHTKPTLPWPWEVSCRPKHIRYIIYIYTYVCVAFIYIYIYTCYKYTNTCIYIYIRYEYIYIYIHINIYICKYIYIYIHICQIYIYISKYIYVTYSILCILYYIHMRLAWRFNIAMSAWFSMHDSISWQKVRNDSSMNHEGIHSISWVPQGQGYCWYGASL